MKPSSSNGHFHLIRFKKSSVVFVYYSSPGNLIVSRSSNFWKFFNIADLCTVVHLHNCPLIRCDHKVPSRCVMNPQYNVTRLPLNARYSHESHEVPRGCSLILVLILSFLSSFSLLFSSRAQQVVL